MTLRTISAALALAALVACGGDKGGDSASDTDTTGTATGGTTTTGTATGGTATGGTATGGTATGGTATGGTATGGTATGGTTAMAMVRATHLGVNVPAVNVFANDDATPVFEELMFEMTSGYASVPAATYDFDISLFPEGPDASVLPIDGVELMESSYTVVAYGELGAGVAAHLFDDTADGLDAANVRLNILHGAYDVGEVDIWDLTDPAAPSALLEDVPYGAAASLDVPGDTSYMLGLDANDDMVADLMFDTGVLPAGAVIDVVAKSDGFPNVDLVAILPDGTTAPIPAQPLLRVVHLGVDVPPVNVFANDGADPAVAELPYQGVAGYITVPAGMYDFDVSIAPGGADDSVLPIDGVDLTAGSVSTVVAYGQIAAGVNAALLNDDSNGVAADMVRLNILHGGYDVGEVDIWNVTDPMAPTPIVENVSLGMSATVDVPADAYMIGIDATDDGVPELTFDTGMIAGGQTVEVIATSERFPTLVFLDVVFEDGTYARLSAM